jgi:hypothetical protein
MVVLVTLLSLIDFTLSYATPPQWDWDAANSTTTCTTTDSPPSPHPCGFMLTNAGWWNELSRCTDGYHWSYVLRNFSSEENGTTLLCGGISIASGFVEFPCIPMTISLEDFRLHAATQEVAFSPSTKDSRYKLKELACFRWLNQPSLQKFMNSTRGQRVPQIKEMSTTELQCLGVRCRGSQCGCQLLQDGWKELKRCDNHLWSYLIEKGSERRACAGISALGGREEYPCTAYKGKVSLWRCAERLPVPSQ